MSGEVRFQNSVKEMKMYFLANNKHSCCNSLLLSVEYHYIRIYCDNRNLRYLHTFISSKSHSIINESFDRYFYRTK